MKSQACCKAWGGLGRESASPENLFFLPALEELRKAAALSYAPLWESGPQACKGQTPRFRAVPQLCAT